jgi:two-component system CheB/CheR fusion protein
MGSLLHRRLLKDGNSHADYAHEVHKVLTTALSDARDLSHGLHPIKSTSGGLLEALSQMAQKATRLYHTSCAFDYDEAAIVEEPAAITHLYRIAQEALTNALKHGKATRVDLSLRNSAAGITLTIQDNGIGIQPQAQKGGLGLQLMKHRAQSIGATLEILPGRESGTLVQCTFPQGEGQKVSVGSI